MMEMVLTFAIILALAFYATVGLLEMLYLISLILFLWYLAVLIAELLLLIFVAVFLGIGTGLLGVDSAKTKIGKFLSFWGYGVLVGGLSGTILALIFWRVFLPNILMVAGFYLISKSIAYWPFDTASDFHIYKIAAGVLLAGAAVWLKIKNKEKMKE